MASNEALPPSYAPIQGVETHPSQVTNTDTDNAVTSKADPTQLPFKPYVDGTSLPVLENGPAATDGDLERSGSNGKPSKKSKIFHAIFPCIKLHRHTKEKFGFAAAAVVFSAVVLLCIGGLGGIIFGITVGVERSLTGEDFWSPNHNRLFRICESDSTSSKPFQLHTCNVFRPNHDLNASPLHSFPESVRSWSTGSGSKLQGQARRIDAVRLDALLLTYGLKCSVPKGVTPPPSNEKAQIIIGGVGQGFDRKKHATACNYYANGHLAQDSCARYNDGGVRSVGKTWPMGINAIMTKHFGMKCEWVA